MYIRKQEDDDEVEEEDDDGKKDVLYDVKLVEFSNATFFFIL